MRGIENDNTDYSEESEGYTLEPQPKIDNDVKVILTFITAIVFIVTIITAAVFFDELLDRKAEIACAENSLPEAGFDCNL